MGKLTKRNLGLGKDRSLEIHKLLNPDTQADTESNGFGPLQGDRHLHKLSDKHHRILRMLVLGYDKKAIERVVGCSRYVIAQVKASPLARIQMDFMRGHEDKKTYDVAQMIKDCLPECVETLIRQVRDDDVAESLKSRNALALLAIGGHGQTSKTAIVHAHLTPDRISNIKQRAIEMGLMEGTIVAGDDEIIDA